MPRMKLTDQAVKRLTSRGSDRMEYFDVAFPAFGLRVTDKGRKSWIYFYRLHGRQTRLTLGHYPAMSLADAHKAASNADRRVRANIDPKTARARARDEAEREAANTVDAVVSEWLKRDQGENKSAGDVRRALEHDVLPAWGERPIGTVTRRDVMELLDKIADRGAPIMARRVHAYLHRLFRWCVQRGIIEASPMADLPKPSKETARDRVLSDGELARIWHGAETLGRPFGPAVRLLVLTGARREEVGGLRWAEIDTDSATIRLRGERTKNGAPHDIPLSTAAVEILDALPRIADPDTKKVIYAFTTTGGTPASGWSRAKDRLDAKAAAIGADGEKLDESAPLPAWRLHDLRRTVATGLQRLGFRLEVIEAVLGHVSGSRAGIVGVYQRHAFEDEKRRALEAWGRHVRNLIEPPASNVVALEAGDGRAAQ